MHVGGAVPCGVSMHVTLAWSHIAVSAAGIVVASNALLAMSLQVT